MKFTNLGGATAIVEHNGKRMLFDPWLDEGIFHGAWFHYPPLQVGLEDLGRFDYIYISHIHEDHCSAGTIRHLNSDAEIILMEKRPNFVAKFLETHGFRFKKIHSIPARTPTQLAEDLWVEMIEADPAHELNHLIDSAMILRWGDKVLYNANDCPPYPAALDYINQHYPHIDLALIPYTGGSGYPACYHNLSNDEKIAECQRILQQGLQTFIDTVKTLNPIQVMPFADQYVIGGSRHHLNRFMAHPPSPAIVTDILEIHGYSKALVLLNSGQSLDLTTNEKVPNTPYHRHTEQEREAYIETIRQSPYDHEKITFAPTVPIERLMTLARQRLWEQQVKANLYQEGFSLYIDVPDRGLRFLIPLNDNCVEKQSLETPKTEPYWSVSCPSTLLIMMLLGHVSWNIADAALFLDYERSPNVYNPEHVILLNYLKI